MWYNDEKKRVRSMLLSLIQSIKRIVKDDRDAEVA